MEAISFSDQKGENSEIARSDVIAPLCQQNSYFFTCSMHVNIDVCQHLYDTFESTYIIIIDIATTSYQSSCLRSKCSTSSFRTISKATENFKYTGKLIDKVAS